MQMNNIVVDSIVVSKILPNLIGTVIKVINDNTVLVEICNKKMLVSTKFWEVRVADER